MARYLDPKNDLTFKRIFGEHPDLLIGFLKEVDERMLSLPAELAENKQILKAAELCLEGGFTPEELAVYEAYWDWVRVEKTIREGSEARGRAEGKAERDQLEAKYDQLKAEKEKDQENMVINSRKAGLPVETILTITGLTSEQIIEILKRHGLT